MRVNTEDGESVRERITVGQDEEELLIPGQYQALFDFKRVSYMFPYTRLRVVK
ncbi:MAG: hypothetical protein ABW185_09120 [Sedimenticola sp.]